VSSSYPYPLTGSKACWDREKEKEEKIRREKKGRSFFSLPSNSSKKMSLLLLPITAVCLPACLPACHLLL